MENILLRCPGCQGPLKQINYNEGWHKETCQNECLLEYEKFSITDNGYLKFTLKDFKVLVHIDFFGIKDKIYIYHKIPKRVEVPGTENYYTTAAGSEAFIIPRFEIEWDKLDYYNERWKLWKAFS